MSRILLASAAVVALAIISAPAFAEDASLEAKLTNRASNASEETADTVTRDTQAPKINNMKNLIKQSPVFPQHGDSFTKNIAYVQQIGDENANTQEQTGSVNTSHVHQVGNKNSSNVLQNSTISNANNTDILKGTHDGRNASMVGQTGNENEAIVKQYGYGQQAFAIAEGNVNRVNQTQSGGGHLSSVYQMGTHDKESFRNIATTTQSGNRTNEPGVGNEAYISQIGYTNQASVSQNGTNHRSVQIQIGKSNRFREDRGFTVQQHGDAQDASQLQVGDTNRADIRQGLDERNESPSPNLSKSNVASQYQIGFGMIADVVQTGSSNLAMQVQHGSFNTARITQSSDNNIGVQVQAGLSGDVLLTQKTGNDNRSTQFQGQAGRDDYASAMQDGSGNRSTQTQN